MSFARSFSQSVKVSQFRRKSKNKYNCNAKITKVGMTFGCLSLCSLTVSATATSSSVLSLSRMHHNAENSPLLTVPSLKTFKNICTFRDEFNVL